MQWMRRKFVVGTGLSRVARNREGSFGLTGCCCLGLALVPASSLQASAPIVERGGYFTTAKDLARLRAQATDPRLQSAYRQTKVDSDKMVAKWEKIFPADRPAPTTAELLAFGGKSVDRDAGYASVAIECALDPTPRNKRVLREMMIADLGWRQKLNLSLIHI